MANCPNCARRGIKKSKDGVKRCPRCGTLPNGINLRRDGTRAEAVADMNEAVAT